jgi:hypothetical protein
MIYLEWKDVEVACKLMHWSFDKSITTPNKIAIELYKASKDIEISLKWLMECLMEWSQKGSLKEVVTALYRLQDFWGNIDKGIIEIKYDN